MKNINRMTDKEKFNILLQQSKEYLKNYPLFDTIDKDISYSIPFFILGFWFNKNKDQSYDILEGLGSNDEGIDGFFVDEEEKTYYLLQFKTKKSYNQVEDRAKKEWFSLLEVFDRKVDSPNFKTKNKRIKEIIEEIHEIKQDYKCKKIIFDLGSCSEDILENHPDIEYYDQNSILKSFINYIELDEDKKQDDCYIEIENSYSDNSNNNFIKISPPGRNGIKRNSIIFTINGKQIVELLSQGSTILDRNVRGFLGETNTVNKGIIQTALQEPEHFYFFNNGITITCDKIDFITSPNNKKIKIKLVHPQIINGAQTVNSINAAYNKKTLRKNDFTEADKHFKKITVLCKILESNKDEATIFANNVKNYSNKQNKIKDTDFYSNRKEQKTIKEEMKKYKIEYCIKRGTTSKTDFINNVDMEELAEIHMAQIIEPFFAKSSIIFKDGSEEDLESHYYKIFGNNGSLDSKRTLSLAKSFYIHKYINNFYKKIKKVFKDLEINKDISKDDKIFVQQLLLISPNIFDKKIIENDDKAKWFNFYELKNSLFFCRKIIDNMNFYNEENNEYSSIFLVFEKALHNNNEAEIEKIMFKVAKENFKIYLKIIKNINKTSDRKIRKTKENLEIITDSISEFVNDSDNNIKWQF